jgi:DNA-binding LytR/AlgR family response regulator
MDTNCLFVWQSDRFERLDLEQVCYFESGRQGCRVVSRSGAFALNRTLVELEQRLDAAVSTSRGTAF